MKLFPSYSLAFCGFLVRKTKDTGQIDRLFRKSKLFRSKWDEKRGNSTYGANTILKALKKVTKEENQEEKTAEKKEEKQFDKYGIPIEFKDLYKLEFKKTRVSRVIICHDKIADLIIKELNTLYFKELYVYEQGIYRVGEDAVKARLTEIIRCFKEAFRHFVFNMSGIDKEVLYQIKYKSPYLDFPFNNHINLLPVKNGILSFDFEAEKVELLPLDPKYKFTYQLTVTYDPNADPEPVDQILKEYTEVPEILYQIPAQAVLQMIGYGPYKKAYLIQGRPDAGKSTFLDFLWSCFGEKNRADVPLNELNAAENRFKLANLVGKVFNLHDDLRSFLLKDVGTFKRITGAYCFDVEKKGIQCFPADIRAVHVYTCNNPPTIAEKDVRNDEAFWNRWEYVLFANKFNMDPEFKNRNFTEANYSGFLNKVIDTALKMGKENKLLRDSSYSEVRQMWIRCAEPVFMFIMENMDKIAGTERNQYFYKEDFYNVVKDWATSKELDDTDLPPNVTMLSKVLKDVCEVDIDSKPTNAKTGLQEHCYGFPYHWKDKSEWKDRIKPIETKKEQAKFE